VLQAPAVAPLLADVAETREREVEPRRAVDVERAAGNEQQRPRVKIVARDDLVETASGA